MTPPRSFRTKEIMEEIEDVFDQMVSREMQVMRSCFEMLRPLIPDSKTRIVQWLVSRTQQDTRTPQERRQQLIFDVSSARAHLASKEKELVKLERDITPPAPVGKVREE